MAFLGVNQVILIGIVGQPIKLKYNNAGKECASISLATGRLWKDAIGQEHRMTDWHRVVCYGATAARCAKFLTKGSYIWVRGELRTRKYLASDKKDRYITEVIAIKVEFLPSAKKPMVNKPSSESDSEPEIDPDTFNYDT